MEIIEIHIPTSLVILIIGYQIAIYFFYQYKKSRPERIGFNRILLAYGLLYSIIFTGIYLRVVFSYYYKAYYTNFMINFTQFLISFGFMIFLIIIATKPFKEIIKLLYTKALTVFAIIMSILILLVNDLILSALLKVATILLGLSIFIFFHYKLIQSSTKVIKKRLAQILIGEIIIIVSIILGIEEIMDIIPETIRDVYLLTLIPFLFLGLSIVFLGVYNFPTFLEFGWKNNLMELHIIDQNRNTQLFSYSFNYTSNEKSRETDSLIPRGLIGIDEIIAKVTGTEKERLMKIEQADVQLLLDSYSSPNTSIIFALLVKKDLTSIDFILKKIKNLFRDTYTGVILDLELFAGAEPQLFQNFKPILENLMENY